MPESSPCARARRGARVSRSRPDARARRGGGLPTVVATGTGARQRRRAPSGDGAGGPAPSLFALLPRSTWSTIRSPSRFHARPRARRHLARRPAPGPAAALLARRAAVPEARLRPGVASGDQVDRDQRVGPRAVVERLGLDPEHVHAVRLGVDTLVSRPSRPSRASRSSSTPRVPGRTRTTRACSRRSPGCAARPELRLLLTGVGPTVRAAGRASRRAARRGRSSSTCTGAPPRSSSRASTRDSGCRRSRRWRAAVRSPHRPPPRCRRCRRRGRPLRPARPGQRSRQGSTRPSNAPQSSGARAARAAGFTWDETARAHDRVYELAVLLKALELGIDEQRDEPGEVDAPAPAERSRARVGSPTR